MVLSAVKAIQSPRTLPLHTRARCVFKSNLQPASSGILRSSWFCCVCAPFLHRAWFFIPAWRLFKHEGWAEGIWKSLPNEALCKHPMTARIDHPCVPVPNQFELLISVPVQCCAVNSIHTVSNSVDRILFWPQLGLLGAPTFDHQLQLSKPVQCVHRRCLNNLPGKRCVSAGCEKMRSFRS